MTWLHAQYYCMNKQGTKYKTDKELESTCLDNVEGV